MGPTCGLTDGFVALRIRDIKRIDWASGARFTRHSLKAHGVWPPAAPGHRINLDREVRGLVDSVAAGSTLVAIHPELHRADVATLDDPSAGGVANYDSTRSTRRAVGMTR